MSENEKKHESQSCCCCQSWKAIFIALALLAIGAAFGHVMTMKHCCPMMMGRCGDNHSMKAFWDRGEREREGGWENKCQGEKEFRGEQKGWFEHRADTGKHKPGCTCPMCSQKGAWLPDPNKAGCPMMDKKAGKSKKD
jgi:hypothetical protein